MHYTLYYGATGLWVCLPAAIASLVCEHSTRQLKYLYFGDYVSGCEWLSGKTSIFICEQIGSYMVLLTGKKCRTLYILRSKLKKEYG